MKMVSMAALAFLIMSVVTTSEPRNGLHTLHMAAGKNTND